MKNPPLSLVILMEEGAQIGKDEKGMLRSVDLVSASSDSRQLWCVISDQLVALHSCENLHQPGALWKEEFFLASS